MHKYIIVGAGSAGCVLANRLSLKEKTLLIEAGRSDKLIDKFRIQMPSAMGLNLHNNRYNWNYKTSE
jgi:choline dehydrogenase